MKNVKEIHILNGLIQNCFEMNNVKEIHILNGLLQNCYEMNNVKEIHILNGSSPELLWNEQCKRDSHFKRVFSRIVLKWTM